jgi:ElaB/YqjD/DUF883 family membrane-anchored ribosome-binding protein
VTQRSKSESKEQKSAAEAADVAVDKAFQVKDVVVQKAIEVKDAAVDKASEFKDVAVEKAADLKDAAVEKAEEAKEVITETYDEVSYQTRKVGRATWTFTKDNAVPLAMIGVGAGWLISNSRRSKPDLEYVRPSRRYGFEDEAWDRTLGRDEYEPGLYEATAYEPSAYPRGYQRRSARPVARVSTPTQEQTHSRRQPGATAGLGERVKRQAGRAGEHARALYEQAGEGLHRAESLVAENAERGADYVQSKLRRARDASRELADSNPIAVGMATLIAGVGVGLLLPAMRSETRLLEPAFDKCGRVLDKRDSERKHARHPLKVGAAEALRGAN